MPTSPTVTLTGTIYDLKGVPNAGKVVLQLDNYGDASPSVTRSAVFAPFTATAQAAADGTFSVNFYGNHQITPSYTTYVITVYAAGSNAPLSSGVYQFNVDGVYDLASIVPVVTPTGGTINFAPNYAAGTATTPVVYDNSNTIATTQFVNTEIAATKVIGPFFYAANYAGADTGAKVNAAIAAAVSVGGGVVQLGPGTFAVSTQISLSSGVHLVGAGSNMTTLVGGVGANAVVRVNGSSGVHISNVRIANLQIQNGTAQTGSATAGRDGIRLDYCDNFIVERCAVNSIQGNYGICVKNSTYGTIRENKVSNFTYAGIAVGLGSHDMRIENNVVDGAVTTGINSYGIIGASAGETPSDPGAYAYNVWVRGNTVRNIPIWEGIDFHGGLNIWVENNLIENVSTGILAALADDAVAQAGITSPLLSNVTIRNNKITQGTGVIGGRGIVCQGSDTVFSRALTDLWVEGNTCTGFGSTASALRGQIELSDIRNFHVRGNHSHDYSQNAVYVLNSIQGEVSANVMYDMVGHASTAASAVFIDVGTWNVIVENNFLVPSTLANSPYYFLRVNARESHVSLGRNYVRSVQTSDFVSFVPAGYSVAPASGSFLNFVNGDRVWDSLQRPAWYASAGDGIWSIDSSTVISTANITSGQTTLTAFAGGAAGSFAKYFFPVGMNITVAGAAAGPSALNAKVIANDGTTITLDIAAGTTVTGANVTYQSGVVLNHISQNPALWETVYSSSPFQGIQIRADKSLYNTSSFGFSYSNGGPYQAYNAIQNTQAVDSWHQTNAAASSYLVRVTSNGFELFVAAPGTADGNFATFWGTARTSMASSGSVFGTTTLGSGGTPVTLVKVYTPSLTPSSVAANTTAEQTFTVTGLTTADKVVVNGPLPTAGTGIVNARVSAADTLKLTFSNTTAGALTPVSGTYNIVAVRS